MTSKVIDSNSLSCDLSKNKWDDSLTDEDYIRLGEHAAHEVQRYVSDLSLWENISSKNGIEILERKSDLPGAAESMLLLITDLPCSMEKVEKLVTPWLEYRTQWDDMLEKAELITSWPEKEVFLLRHLIRKQYILSARESIDVVKVMRRENELVFGSTGASHVDYPPAKGYVRTHQFLGGYVLRPSDAKHGHIKFHMLFHADLNLPVPRFIGNVLVKFKPDLMVKKTENLKGAIQKFDI